MLYFVVGCCWPLLARLIRTIVLFWSKTKTKCKKYIYGPSHLPGQGGFMRRFFQPPRNQTRITHAPFVCAVALLWVAVRILNSLALASIILHGRSRLLNVCRSGTQTGWLPKTFSWQTSGLGKQNAEERVLSYESYYSTLYMLYVRRYE